MTALFAFVHVFLLHCLATASCRSVVTESRVLNVKELHGRRAHGITLKSRLHRRRRVSALEHGHTAPGAFPRQPARQDARRRAVGTFTV